MLSEIDYNNNLRISNEKGDDKTSSTFYKYVSDNHVAEISLN